MTNEETLNTLTCFHSCITANNFTCWKTQHDCESCPFYTTYSEQVSMIEKSIQIIQQTIDKENNNDEKNTI